MGAYKCEEDGQLGICSLQGPVPYRDPGSLLTATCSGFHASSCCVYWPSEEARFLRFQLVYQFLASALGPERASLLLAGDHAPLQLHLDQTISTAGTSARRRVPRHLDHPPPFSCGRSCPAGDPCDKPTAGEASRSLAGSKGPNGAQAWYSRERGSRSVPSAAPS